MTESLEFRLAVLQDLDQIVAMLADDVLGSKRERYEQPLPASYLQAFQAIAEDPNNELVVACFGIEVVGVQQITFTPYITHQGGWRATIEGVRTASSVRGKGVGTQLINWAIERAKERGCHLIQLTTDKQRPDALRFYERLGFQATHEGLKMKL
ncbi:N-acetyltransferase GCN5 [Niallia circulans]|uniref:GNAT family N-acetyltransferase n=1 Tax=Niallia TaxID=2837506 RepID=UPI00077CA955|nr:GNAT family N-acetyltransferase [Niallia circulans]MDR4315271.1 GNAT family N-acetyltransferase [Niallia circulans]MED3840927.1 GNAT family N-acetyltransferase [Niallia circulans]MED4241498.1 GNAT family N-acetyltransferase [Niallia circulans]MED4248158.1 GNAT family N-acetyltransferase [Niallia circulans]MED5103186.1 GNAT family N-acetyltransferase [Niallia circulans]